MVLRSNFRNSQHSLASWQGWKSKLRQGPSSAFSQKLVLADLCTWQCLPPGYDVVVTRRQVHGRMT